MHKTKDSYPTMSDEAAADLKRPSATDGATEQSNDHDGNESAAPVAKRMKVDNDNDIAQQPPKQLDARDDRDRGMAKIKPE